MSDDDLYINGSSVGGDYYPEVSLEQKEAEIAQISPIAASYPILDSLADWFNEVIADCNNLDNIYIKGLQVGATRYTPEVSIQAQILAYKLLKDLLIEKSQLFSNFGKDGEV